jgi:hypothetical protein
MVLALDFSNLMSLRKGPNKYTVLDVCRGLYYMN